MMLLGWRIFDLRGPDFLMVFVGLIVVAIGFRVVLGKLLRFPFGEATSEELARLPQFGLAFLGTDLHEARYRAVHGALGSLLASGCLELVGPTTVRAVRSPGERRVLVEPPQAGFGYRQGPRSEPAPVDSLEIAVYEWVRLADRDMAEEANRKSLVANCDGEFTRLRSVLERQGMLQDETSRVIRAAVFSVPFILVGWIGINKLLIGLDRGKPVGILVVLLVFFAIVAMASIRTELADTLRTSEKGEWSFARCEVWYEGLLATLRSAPNTVAGSDIGRAVGLYTAQVALGTSALGRSLGIPEPPKPVVSSSGGSSCSSCSSCGGGGCGGGCGGCS